MEHQSEVTLTIDMPPEDLRKLYEDARGNEIELAKLIWLEHTRRQDADEQREEMQTVVQYLAIQPAGWTGAVRGLTAGAMAALELLDLDLMSETTRKGKQTPFGDMLLLAFITQADPDEWYDSLTDKAEAQRRAVRWGHGIDLPQIMDIVSSMMEQVSKLGDVISDKTGTGDAKKKAAVNGHGSRITKRR
jgi:hypothetical protein